MEDQLAIIVGTINPRVLPDFLKSVSEQKNKNFHVFLIDISNSDFLSTLKDKRVTVVRSENKGYSHNVNVGIKLALQEKYSKFCVINDDTFFDRDFVSQALSSIEKNPRCLIGGKIYYAPEFEYHKDRYEKGQMGRVLWYAGGSFDWDHVLSKHRGVDEVDTGQYDNREETGFITGALVLYDKSVLDVVGDWDESYFLYYEDADYCIRAKKAGIRLVYDPSVVIWHKTSQSTGGSGSDIHVKYQTKNRLRFGLKYAPLWTKLHLLKNFFFAKRPKT